MTNSPRDLELPDWYVELVSGSGSAALLDPDVRAALRIVTEALATELAVATTAALEKQRADAAKREDEARADAVRAKKREDARRAVADRAELLEERWKVTEVLWILFWIGVVIAIDVTIDLSFADPYSSDPSSRFGYNFITCALVDVGILIPALICRAVVHSLRDRKRKEFLLAKARAG
jgi:hypothetical protein